MSKLQKRASMFVGLSLVITFTFLIHLRFARAEEMEGILPSQGLDSVTLLVGQSVNFDGTFVTSSGIHSIGVLSLGNQSLEVKLGREMTNITGGLWWIFLIGTSTANGIDFVFGFPPLTGETAKVSFELPIGLGFAIFGVSSTSPASTEDPIGYRINVAGKL